jgi:hypothetical protein
MNEELPLYNFPEDSSTSVAPIKKDEKSQLYINIDPVVDNKIHIVGRPDATSHTLKLTIENKNKYRIKISENFYVYVEKRPSWFHRFAIRVVFGWIYDKV